MRISDWSSDVCSSDLLRRRIGRTLAGAGWVEVVDFPFVGEPDLDALGLEADDPRRTVLRLSNPLSRSEERRVGKECVSTCRSRWSPSPSKNKNSKKSNNTYILQANTSLYNHKN